MAGTLTLGFMRWWLIFWFRHFEKVEAADFFAFNKKRAMRGGASAGWNRASRFCMSDAEKVSLFVPSTREIRHPSHGTAQGKEIAVLKSKKKLAEPWFVYIVRCSDGSLYTGIAKNVDRRLEQHNAGTASRYTRSRLPVTLEYQEEQPNQSCALKRELAIKAMSRKAKDALIQSAK